MPHDQIVPAQRSEKKYFESGSVASIQPHHAQRLRMLLAALDTAQAIEDMNVPGFRLHPLKGEDKSRCGSMVIGGSHLSSKAETHTFWFTRIITDGYA
jgi:toxin HigB-1